MPKYIINTYNRKSVIRREIYGHFAEHLGRCIYEGLYVEPDSPILNEDGMRRDLLDALRRIGFPVLRWPGGCFADAYHWRDGIGPGGQRKPIVNFFWGGVMEDNSFGTHEYMRLCELIGCEPYINGNLGSGTVQEMAEWVEYLTFGGKSPMSDLRATNGRAEPWRVKYFGVGNENWGCGGTMCPQFYADQFKRYQTYLRDYSGNRLYKIACGPDGENYAWMETVMAAAGSVADAVSLHYYTLGGPDWQHKGSAVDFGVAQWYASLKRSLRIDEIITRHEKIMDRYDPAGRVGLVVDEWGSWYEVEPGTNPAFLYQQNTMRDAMIAATTLNIFNKHSRRVVMANLAQTVNVLQSLALTKGRQIILTPTYHVFDMFQNHQGATLVDTFLQTEMVGNDTDAVTNLQESASIGTGGTLTVTVCNLSHERSYEVDALVIGREAGRIRGRILSASIQDHNTFDRPTAVVPHPLTGIGAASGGFTLSLPPASIVALTVG